MEKRFEGHLHINELSSFNAGGAAASAQKDIA